MYVAFFFFFHLFYFILLSLSLLLSLRKGTELNLWMDGTCANHLFFRVYSVPADQKSVGLIQAVVILLGRMLLELIPRRVGRLVMLPIKWVGGIDFWIFKKWMEFYRYHLC